MSPLWATGLRSRELAHFSLPPRSIANSKNVGKMVFIHTLWMTECFLIERKTNKLTSALAKTLYGNIDIVRSVVELPTLFQFIIEREILLQNDFCPLLQ